MKAFKNVSITQYSQYNVTKHLANPLRKVISFSCSESSRLSVDGNLMSCEVENDTFNCTPDVHFSAAHISLAFYISQVVKWGDAVRTCRKIEIPLKKNFCSFFKHVVHHFLSKKLLLPCLLTYEAPPAADCWWEGQHLRLRVASAHQEGFDQLFCDQPLFSSHLSSVTNEHCYLLLLNLLIILPALSTFHPRTRHVKSIL